MEFKYFDEFSMSFGLIKCAGELAANSFLNWQRKILSELEFAITIEERCGSLRSVLDDLYPLSGPIPTKYLFWQLNDEWTLYLDNGYGGVDAGAPIVLSSRLGVDSIRVVVERELVALITRQVINFPATIFEYYSNGMERRHIFSVYDGKKWMFGQSGEMFQFEDSGSYKNRSIKNRFSASMLMNYLRELGLDLDKISVLNDETKSGYFLRKSGGDGRRLPIAVECSKAMNLSIHSL